MRHQDIEQYAFTRLLEEAEAAQQAEFDEHRTKVQRWFEALMPEPGPGLSASSADAVLARL